MTDMQSETVYSLMARLLNIKIESETDLLRLCSRGLSPQGCKRAMQKLDLPLDVIGSASTARRRLQGSKPLTQTESERVLRVVRVYAKAVKLFGTEPPAMAWMKAPATFVQGRPAIKPMDLARYDSGARLLEAKIRCTAYEIYDSSLIDELHDGFNELLVRVERPGAATILQNATPEDLAKALHRSLEADKEKRARRSSECRRPKRIDWCVAILVRNKAIEHRYMMPSGRSWAAKPKRGLPSTTGARLQQTLDNSEKLRQCLYRWC